MGAENHRRCVFRFFAADLAREFWVLTQEENAELAAIPQRADKDARKLQFITACWRQ